MEDRDSGSAASVAFHRIDDPRQAGMLMDPDVRRYFEPFVARAVSVTGAAAEVGCEPSKMLYRVGTFVRAGLLRVVGERKRAGRPVKLYRSSHDAYLIPYALTAYATLEEAFAAGYQANARRFAHLVAQQFRGQRWDGYRLHRHASGETWFAGAPDETKESRLDDPDRPPGLDYAVDVVLTEAEAREVQDLLLEILRRYPLREAHGADEDGPRARETEGRRAYMLSVAFARVVGDDGA